MNGAIGPRAGRREWIGLGVIALPCLLYSMDLTVLDLAVPALSTELRPSSAQLLWIVDIYGFLVAGSLVTMGTLGDRIGRRRLLLIGAGAFGVGSVLAAFSRSAEMLIATRALLGIAGATLAPSTLSLIRNMFLDAHQRTVAIGIWASSYSAGAAIGPLVGGALLEHFWWGSVFLIGVPVMVLLLVVGPVLLPEFKDPEAGRLDPISAVLSLACVLLVIYGVKRIAENGAAAAPVAAIGGGVAIGVAFIRRQRTLPDPLVDLALFRVPAFGAALAMYALATFVAFGIFIFITQYLQLVLGLSPLHAGLWTMPFALAFIAGSLLAPRIVRHVSPARVMALSLAVAAIGFGLLSQAGAHSGPGIVVTAIAVYAFGLAPTVTLATDMIVGRAPPERAGAASAISETGSELGGALGIAVLGSVGTAVYRSRLGGSAVPGLPADVLEAARSNLGSAVAVAGHGQVGDALVAAARSAFMDSMHTSALISAAIMLGTAALAGVVLRTARTDANEAAPEPAIARDDAA